MFPFACVPKPMLVVAGGGVVYERTAFVQNGATGGSLNTIADPYGDPGTALTALASAHYGESVTVRYLDAVTVDVFRWDVEPFPEVTFMAHTGTIDLGATHYDLRGADSVTDGIAGENSLPPILNITGLLISTLTVSGGAGSSGEPGINIAENGNRGGDGGDSITVNLRSGTVVTTLTGDGGDVPGAGGQGGPGDGGNTSGNGGPGADGGNGATVNRDASSSATSYTLTGGTGGAGGAPGPDGGNGEGSPGAAGSNGTAGSYNLTL